MIDLTDLSRRIDSAVRDYRRVWPKPHKLPPNLSLAVEALDLLHGVQGDEETPVIRSRITRSPDAIYGEPRRCRRRRRCDGHLADPHWLEVGELVVWSALPPDSDVGNVGWWHAAFCRRCWPEDIPVRCLGGTHSADLIDGCSECSP